MLLELTLMILLCYDDELMTMSLSVLRLF